MARSDVSMKRAADRVEHAETSAKYEYPNLLVGGIGDGLSTEEIRSICNTFNVELVDTEKHTVITGVSSGIGYETAKAFVARGKNLIVTARRRL